VEKSEQIGVVLLAAGGSTRLGRPKQLLDYNGQPLLWRAVETALASRGRPVVVVLGAHAEACAEALHGLAVRIVVNPNWRDGLASSIRVGIEELERENKRVAAAILGVADQPLLSVEILNELAERHVRDGAAMVAAEYGGKLGVPALFAASYFERLKMLRGDEGARQLLRENANAVVRVPFPGGAVDVDTPADAARLAAQSPHCQGPEMLHHP
jgi:molybdenum cofactor cytidylyltransferase